MGNKSQKWLRSFTVQDFFLTPTFWMEIMGAWTTNFQRFFPKPLEFLGPLLGNIFRLFVVLVMLHLEIVLGVTTVTKFKNEGLIECFLFFLNFVIYFWILVVIAFYATQERKLRKYFMEINRGFRRRSAPGLTYVTVEPGYRMARKMLNVWQWSCILTGGSYALLPLITGKHELPLPTWYPFDIEVRDFS